MLKMHWFDQYSIAWYILNVDLGKWFTMENFYYPQLNRNLKQWKICARLETLLPNTRINLGIVTDISFREIPYLKWIYIKSQKYTLLCLLKSTLLSIFSKVIIIDIFAIVIVII